MGETIVYALFRLHVGDIRVLNYDIAPAQLQYFTLPCRNLDRPLAALGYTYVTHHVFVSFQKRHGSVFGPSTRNLSYSFLLLNPFFVLLNKANWKLAVSILRRLGQQAQCRLRGWPTTLHNELHSAVTFRLNNQAKRGNKGSRDARRRQLRT